MKVLIFLLSSLFFISGCAMYAYDYDTKLSDSGRRVKISDRLPPATVCKEKGVIYATVEDRGNYLEDMIKEVRLRLRNKSADRGGNYVRIETNNTTTYGNRTIITLSGTSYLCHRPKQVAENRK